MAENIPNMPTGAVPPKPAEAAKVQPKKETVRINLPPKPTAAPTIKIPVPAAVSAAPPAAASAPAAVPVASPAAAPAVSAAAAAPRAAAPAAPKPVLAPRPAVASTVSGLDTGLAIAAVVIGIALIVRLLIL